MEETETALFRRELEEGLNSRIFLSLRTLRQVSHCCGSAMDCWRGQIAGATLTVVDGVRVLFGIVAGSSGSGDGNGSHGSRESVRSAKSHALAELSLGKMCKAPADAEWNADAMTGICKQASNIMKRWVSSREREV